MSFAIIETGGKQYKVSASKILEIEKLNAKIGETIKFKNVLLLNDDKNTEIGDPSIDGASVEAKLLDISPLAVKFEFNVIDVLSIPTENISVLPLSTENTLLPSPFIWAVLSPNSVSKPLVVEL